MCQKQFSNRTAFRLSAYYIWTFCHSFCDNLKPCDWSTQLPEFSKPVLQYRSTSRSEQSDDISAEVDDEKNVDVISRLIYYGVKTLC